MSPSTHELVTIPLLYPHTSSDSDENVNEKDLELEGVLLSPDSVPTRGSIFSRFFPYLSVLFNVLVYTFLFASWDSTVRRIPWRGAPAIYSPAQDVVTHTRVEFLSLTGRSKYHGPPSAAVDEAWEDLYRHGISSLSKSEASQLANKTERTLGADDSYIAQLDVFHILHCLNTLRKTMWPEAYPLVAQQRYKTISGSMFDHVDHCVNNVREFLTCNVDVTPNRFEYHEGRPMMQFDTIHTCTDFDALREWAKQRASPLTFDDEHNTLGDLRLDGESTAKMALGVGGEHHGHHHT